MNQESLSKDAERLFRKAPYTSPRLTNFGQVRDLTQSGTGTTKEVTCGVIPYASRQKCSSERCVKENIVRIGDHPLGFGLYLFDYKQEFLERWGRGRQFGVMIDEVETVMPEAVFIHSDGYKRVDYGVLGIDRLTH